MIRTSIRNGGNEPVSGCGASANPSKILLMQDHSIDLLDLETQERKPLTDEVKAALDSGLAQLERGQSVTLQESRARIEKVHQEWLKTQQAVRTG